MGNKIHESASADNPLLGVLYNLLASDWKDDRIVFLGDQTDITEEDKNPVLQKLSAERKAWGEPGYDHDYVTDKYKCSPVPQAARWCVGQVHSPVTLFLILFLEPVDHFAHMS